MTEQLETSLLKLRAAVLTRRMKLQGYQLASDEAQRLVHSKNDKEAYNDALLQLQRAQPFWSRFWWNR